MARGIRSQTEPVLSDKAKGWAITTCSGMTARKEHLSLLLRVFSSILLLRWISPIHLRSALW
jgi:hypothetical protein